MAVIASGTIALGSEPILARAPFDAKQAAEFQTQCAEQIGRPVTYSNSIGMKLVLLPRGNDDTLELR